MIQKLIVDSRVIGITDSSLKEYHKFFKVLQYYAKLDPNLKTTKGFITFLRC